MRSPVIAFGLFAAAAVSPSLVSGAPTSPNLNQAAELESAMQHVPRQLSNAPIIAGLGITPAAPATASQPQTADAHRAAEEKLHAPASSKDSSVPSRKRASDGNTAGGNSYSGAASGTTGGTIVNNADGAPGAAGAGVPGITNDGTGGAVNNAGDGGDSESGFSYGGMGDGHGAGGNAYSGSTAASNGGSTINTSNDGIANTDANAAGTGGFDESGDAQGGDASGPPDLNDANNLNKRAGDWNTAGGSAYSGATSSVSGGNVLNQNQGDGTMTNDGANTAGNPGTSFSGYSTGGDGNGLGPGGNAYTGASGPARGGSVVNDGEGGAIDNTDGANTAGTTTGVSETGDAVGGNS